MDLLFESAGKVEGEVKKFEVGMYTADGLAVLRAKSGDRYMVRLFIGDRLIDVYFADPLHLDAITPVDVSPNEPNPPNWVDEYGG